jgi:archaellum component FlaF (FlaF/FlaG flagellin family)
MKNSAQKLDYIIQTLQDLDKKVSNNSNDIQDLGKKVIDNGKKIEDLNKKVIDNGKNIQQNHERLSILSQQTEKLIVQVSENTRTLDIISRYAYKNFESIEIIQKDISHTKKSLRNLEQHKKTQDYIIAKMVSDFSQEEQVM